MDSAPVLLEVKNSRDSEETPAAMEQVFGALGAGGGRGGLLSAIFGSRAATRFASFEIVAANSSIHFFVGVPTSLQTYLESQITAQYPKVLLSPVADYAPGFFICPLRPPTLPFSTPFS